jgi:type IV pilus assembly protein PilF
MKIFPSILVPVSFLFMAACVTEGVPVAEPASDEEAARANLDLAIGYIEQGRPELAIPSLDRALELEPRSADAHSTIAVAYDMTGDPELAEEHHRRATQLAPSEPNTQNRYAVFLCRQNRWQDAEPYFRRAVANLGRESPASILDNAGTCALAAGDLPAAEAQYRAALQANEADVQALRGMVEVSIRADNLLQGRAFYQRLERGATLQATDLLSCYVIESGLGDAAAANACAARLEREFPGSPAVRQLRELQQNAN